MTPDQVKTLKPGEKAPLEAGPQTTTPLPGANKPNPPPIVPATPLPFTPLSGLETSVYEAVGRLFVLAAQDRARFEQAIATLRELTK